MNQEINKIIKKAEQEHSLECREIVRLLELEDEEADRLYQAADRIRARYHGNEVHLRGIIEFSNYCHQNCQYCGLRKDNQRLKRYQMKPREIIETAVRARKKGYRTVVLQSGEDNYEAGRLTRVIREIKDKVDLAITLSVGERDYEVYRLWREAGADRFLLKHETADPELYHQLHPGMDYRARIKRLSWLKELGYQIGSGNIIGLPGQTKATIARDILLFKELDLDMIGIGPFISHPETPLAERKAGKVELTLKTMAISRLLLPRTHIPATTALATIHPEGREMALKAGANVVMPNVGSADYRPFYNIYPSERRKENDNYRQQIENMINSLGMKISCNYGHSLKL